MRIKSVTLYSVPYAVAIASIFVGAQQFAPPVTLIVPWGHSQEPRKLFRPDRKSRAKGRPIADDALNS